MKLWDKNKAHAHDVCQQKNNGMIEAPHAIHCMHHDIGTWNSLTFTLRYANIRSKIRKQISSR